jgi:hypothetical protein
MVDHILDHALVRPSSGIFSPTVESVVELVALHQHGSRQPLLSDPAAEGAFDGVFHRRLPAKLNRWRSSSSRTCRIAATRFARSRKMCSGGFFGAW